MRSPEDSAAGKACSFLERRLGDAPFEEVETHVGSCGACQDEVEWMWYRNLYRALGDAVFWEYMHDSPLRPSGPEDLERLLSWWEQAATAHYTDADRAWIKEEAANHDER